MTDEELLLYYMEDLNKTLDYYLHNPWDEDMHMRLNDGLVDTFVYMHHYFIKQEGGDDS